MFWGLIMEPNRRYTQTVERSFHVSMASLDSSTADDKIVQVMLYYDDLNYLLCSLKKGETWQVPLDLNFEEGTKIAFTSNGCGHVHLTGYLIPEENLDLDDMEEGLEEEEEDEDEEEEIPQLISGHPKRKAQESPKNAKNAKRSKAALQEEESSDEDEDAESDEDSELGPKVNGSVNDDDDDSDEVDEDDDDEDEEEDSSEEEPEIEVKPQQKKQKNQKEQQQLSKKEKQKLANGKDAKQEQQQKKGKTEQPQQQQQQQKKNKAELQQQQQEQKKRVVQGGVQVEDVKVGNGAPAKAGKFVSVYYVGRLANGKKFDSTTQGDGFKFRLGKGEVIKGWDVGIAGMKIGGKRRITIPPGMAYGAKGSPPVIPGNSTLNFEVELKAVH